MNGYHIFLLIELARIQRVINPVLEYDLTWEKGAMLYGLFQTSSFNDANKPEYECIIDFLKDYQKRTSVTVLINCKDIATGHSFQRSIFVDNKEDFNAGVTSFLKKYPNTEYENKMEIYTKVLSDEQKAIIADHTVKHIQTV